MERDRALTDASRGPEDRPLAPPLARAHGDPSAPDVRLAGLGTRVREDPWITDRSSRARWFGSGRLSRGGDLPAWLRLQREVARAGLEPGPYRTNLVRADVGTRLREIRRARRRLGGLRQHRAGPLIPGRVSGLHLTMPFASPLPGDLDSAAEVPVRRRLAGTGRPGDSAPRGRGPTEADGGFWGLDNRYFYTVLFLGLKCIRFPGSE